MPITATLPSADQRRAAVCAALASSPRLLRFAVRITRNLDDAEDAYQRAMEIALSSAPVVEHERFMAWLRTVLRNEALGVAQRRRREGPGFSEDAALTADRSAARDQPGLEEWRHRYQTVTEAFEHLTEPQRACIILQARGASYDDICAATGFTRRKVERSILEGRERLRRWENCVESGEACLATQADMDDVIAGVADRGQRRRVERHTEHCGHCRGVLRTRRHHVEALGALAPACLLPDGLHSPAPRADLVASWFDRFTLAASVRTGGALQMILEAPGPMLARAGAAVGAAAIAVGIGAPLVTGRANEAPAAGAPAVTVASALRPPAPRAAAPRPAAPHHGSAEPATPRRRPARPAPASHAPHPPARPTARRHAGKPAPLRAAQLSRVAVVAQPQRPPRAAAPSAASPSGAPAGHSAPAPAYTPPAAPPSRPTPAPEAPSPDDAGAASISVGPSGP